MGMFGRSSFVKLPKYSKFRYQPRYYDPEQEEREEEKEMKLEKGAFYKGKNKSRIIGAFSDRDLVVEGRRSKMNQIVRMVLLIAMLGLPILFILDLIGTIEFVVAFVLLFVLFILRINKQ